MSAKPASGVAAPEVTASLAAANDAPEPAAASGVALPRAVTWSLAVVAVVAVTHALHLMRSFLLPVALALLLAGVLRPLVGALSRRSLPRAVAAALAMGAALCSVVAILLYLAGPAVAWAERAPEALERIEGRLHSVKASWTRISRATEGVTRMTAVHASDPIRVVAVQNDRAILDLLGATQSAALEALLTVILLYFFLASSSFFFHAGLTLVARDKRERARSCAEEAKRQISVYLGTITCINFCLGAAASSTLALFGVPNPVLWGVLLAALTYVPYLGPIVALTVIGAVSLVSLEEPLHALGATVACSVLSAVEGHLITPVVLGRSLALNPVVIFVALMFWSWAWGIAGAIMAVPILMTLKIACSHTARLGAIALLLGPYDALKPGCTERTP